MGDFLVSPATAVTIVVGLAISFVYLRYMWLALRQASKTRDEVYEGEPDSFSHSFIGAIVAVIASSAVIMLYGFSPQFIYLGVVLALVSPIAVAYTFYRELKD